MMIIRGFLIVLVATLGFYLTLKTFRRNLLDIRSKPKDQVTSGDRYFNYPLMFLWFGYLMVFFVGLIVNNLIIH